MDTRATDAHTSRDARRAAGWRAYLLVRLHLAPHHPEGIGGRVVVDLDSAEGLLAGARRQPLLVAIVVDHHSGPSLANTRLAGGQKENR